jgi:hypothetical protein
MLLKLSLFISILSSSQIEAALRGTTSSHFFDDAERKLAETKISGECTVANFAASVGGKANLASLLKTNNNDAIMQGVLDTKCANSLKPSIDLSDTLGKGPQFLKNYLDGGTTWNDNYEDNNLYVLSKDASVIASVYDADVKTSVFSAPDGGTSSTYPRYFSNFYKGDHECRLGVIECCYTASRLVSQPFQGNADICAFDLKEAAKSNHIKAMSMTLYDTNVEDQAFCSGFAYEEDSFGDSVKYNTLFHMAMKTNLYDKGLVKNIPGAPLCGCVEQMPIVDNASCVKAVEGYTIDSNGNVGVNISWTDCGNLATYYNSLDRSDTEKYFVNSKIVENGTCDAAAASFMNDRMFVSS